MNKNYIARKVKPNEWSNWKCMSNGEKNMLWNINQSRLVILLFFLSDITSHRLQWSITGYLIAEWQSYHFASYERLVKNTLIWIKIRGVSNIELIFQYSNIPTISNIEFFVTLVNSRKLLTNITKGFMLDVFGF